MKKLVLLAICFCGTIAFAQSPEVSPAQRPMVSPVVSAEKKTETRTIAQDEVSLVVSADGETKAKAIDNALRLAIEQTFGTFVSANTEILNDEMVKDEIVTVSSGNIQKYSEVAAVTLPNGNTSVTLNVTVSLSKLVSYAQSKGSKCEFAGATFGANLRMYEFNKKNEQIAIQNLKKQLDAMRPVYDYELAVSDPVLNDGDNSAKVDIVVKVMRSEKTKLFYDIIANTLLSLAMPDYEATPMIKSGFDIKKYYLCLDGNVKDLDELHPYYFYSSEIEQLDSVIWGSICDVSVKDNNGNIFVAKVQPMWIDGQIGHKCYVENRYSMVPAYDWLYKEPNYNVGDYFKKRRTLFLNTDVIVWVFPIMSFNVPLSNLYKITKISALPSKTESTLSFFGNDVWRWKLYQDKYVFQKTTSF